MHYATSSCLVASKTNAHQTKPFSRFEEDIQITKALENLYSSFYSMSKYYRFLTTWIVPKIYYQNTLTDLYLGHGKISAKRVIPLKIHSFFF